MNKIIAILGFLLSSHAFGALTLQGSSPSLNVDLSTQSLPSISMTFKNNQATSQSIGALSGPNASSFKYSVNRCYNVSPGRTCQLTLIFSSRSPAEGSYSAQIEGSSISVVLSRSVSSGGGGGGSPTTSFEILPATIADQEFLLGERQKVLNLTVKNNGSVSATPSLSISNTSLVSFSLNRCNSTIAPSRTCSVSLILKSPASNQTVSSSLIVSESSIQKDSLSLTLKGPQLSSNLACTFNGSSVAHGSSITAYSTASVPFGSSCVSESRVCSNGVLSGSNSFASCNVQSAATCSFGGQTYQHGDSVPGFSVPSLSYHDGTCGSFATSGTCQNGTILNQPASPTCVVTTASCSLDGQTITHGTTVNAYEQSSGATCSSTPRTCLDGILNGSTSAQFLSCTVQVSNPAPALTILQDLSPGTTTSQSSCIAYGIDPYSGCGMASQANFSPEYVDLGGPQFMCVAHDKVDENDCSTQATMFGAYMYTYQPGVSEQNNSTFTSAFNGTKLFLTLQNSVSNNRDLFYYENGNLNLIKTYNVNDTDRPVINFENGSYGNVAKIGSFYYIEVSFQNCSTPANAACSGILKTDLTSAGTSIFYRNFDIGAMTTDSVDLFVMSKSQASANYNLRKINTSGAELATSSLSIGGIYSTTDQFRLTSMFEVQGSIFVSGRNNSSGLGYELYSLNKSNMDLNLVSDYSSGNQSSFFSVGDGVSNEGLNYVRLSDGSILTKVQYNDSANQKLVKITSAGIEEYGNNMNGTGSTNSDWRMLEVSPNKVLVLDTFFAVVRVLDIQTPANSSYSGLMSDSLTFQPSPFVNEWRAIVSGNGDSYSQYVDDGFGGSQYNQGCYALGNTSQHKFSNPVKSGNEAFFSLSFDSSDTLGNCGFGTLRTVFALKINTQTNQISLAKSTPVKDLRFFPPNYLSDSMLFTLKKGTSIAFLGEFSQNTNPMGTPVFQPYVIAEKYDTVSSLNSSYIGTFSEDLIRDVVSELHTGLYINTQLFGKDSSAFLPLTTLPLTKGSGSGKEIHKISF